MERVVSSRGGIRPKDRNHRDLEIEAQAAGFERGAHIRRDGRMTISILFL